MREAINRQSTYNAKFISYPISMYNRSQWRVIAEQSDAPSQRGETSFRKGETLSLSLSLSIENTKPSGEISSFMHCIGVPMYIVQCTYTTYINIHLV